MRLLAVLTLAIAALAHAAEPRDVLRDAAAAYQSGDIPKAIVLYREFLKDHPEAAEVRSNLGAALVRDGQFEPAIEEYRKALDQLPQNRQVRMNLALAYYKVGKISDAITHLQALHDADPLELKPAVLLGDALLQTGESQRAIDVLQPLSEDYPEDRTVAYMLGAALLNLNRTREAKAVLDRIAGGTPTAESEYLLGQSDYQAQNLIPAVMHLARAVELNPKLPGLHSFYGQVLRAAGRLDQAAEQFRLELAINPFDFVANTEVAMQLKQDGKLDEALVRIDRSLQIRPADAGALYQRASIHMMQGSIDKAREEFEDVTRRYPDFSEAHAALATVYYRLKRTADGDRERAKARATQR